MFIRTAPLTHTQPIPSSNPNLEQCDRNPMADLKLAVMGKLTLSFEQRTVYVLRTIKRDEK